VPEERATEPVPPSEAFLPGVSPTTEMPRPHPPRTSRNIVVVLSLLALLCIFWAFFALRRSHRQTSSHLLWSTLFDNNQPVLIVPSDDALVLYEEFTETPVSLASYLNFDYLSHAPEGELHLGAAWFSSHQYTSTADLNLAVRLGRLPEARNAEVEVRNARIISLNDVKSRNIVLIGGPGANPWVELFDDRLNFSVSYDWKTSEGYVMSRHPLNGEPPTFREAVGDGGARRSYGLLAYLPGVSRDTAALLVEGTGMAGTEAAADFPFSPAFEEFSKRLGDSSLKIPYFEVLLETSNLGGNAPEAHIVGYRRITP
jgi:hypothetical protein